MSTEALARALHEADCHRPAGSVVPREYWPCMKRADYLAAALEAEGMVIVPRALVEAAQEVCDPMVADGGGDRWWAAHDRLRAALEGVTHD